MKQGRVMVNFGKNKCSSSYMGHLGLEPRTIRLKAEYSTIELVTHYKYAFNYTKYWNT